MLISSDHAYNDWYGLGVAGGGGSLMVGAACDDDSNSCSGSAYLYDVAKVASLPNGHKCLSAAQCTSGYCVEGVCCDKACGGSVTSDCQACTKKKGARVDGTCVPLVSVTVCRAAVNAKCDIQETCDGTSTAWPGQFAERAWACVMCRRCAAARPRPAHPTCICPVARPAWAGAGAAPAGIACSTLTQTSPTLAPRRALMAARIGPWILGLT